MIFKKITSQLNLEFRAIFGQLRFPGATFLTICLFINIFLNNFLGLFPYIFTSSAHGSFTLALALPLWVGHMTMAIFLNFEASIRHFVPLNTPGPLMPFIALIELVRRIIRPITLAIRLTANMIAGHLLLGLLREKITNARGVRLLILILPLIALLILELAVALIQGYVFALLSSLYLEEVNTAKFM